MEKERTSIQISRRIPSNALLALSPTLLPFTAQVGLRLVGRNLIVQRYREEALTFQSRYAEVRTAMAASEHSGQVWTLILQFHTDEVSKVIDGLCLDETLLQTAGWMRVLQPVSSAKSYLGPLTRQTPQWNGNADNYYYHGTSLGVVRVSGLRGLLGITPHMVYLDEEAANDSQAVYATDTRHYLDHYKNMEPYSSVLLETVDYADRTTRPGRAVLTYLSMRAALAIENMPLLFPSVQDFLQRVVVRFPKTEAPHMDGPRLSAQLASKVPVPMARAEVLLERDIPFPKSGLTFCTELSRTDPENLNRFPPNSAILPLMQSREIDKLSQAIGWTNAIRDRWVPVQTLLQSE